jgi:pSer/pThr/pTyr-binding forkhead associated (FHA) protein
MEVSLIVLNGVHKGRQIPVTTPTFMIGRGKQCQLRPVRQDVGRQHCAVLVKGERVFLRDFGSTNGTILNKNTLVEGDVALSDGDVFDVGPLQFRVAITSPVEDQVCLVGNDLFTGEPFEEEPSLASTIQTSNPNLPKPSRGKPLLLDEGEKLC